MKGRYPRPLDDGDYFFYRRIRTDFIRFNVSFFPIISNIKKSLPGLFGFVGIYFLVRDGEIYIVEINPRLTTSFSGLYETIGCNMIDLLINHKYIKNVITGRELCLLSNE